MRGFKDQKQAWNRVEVYNRIVWLELSCPSCDRACYVPQRNRRLDRTGSLRCFAVCPTCGAHLVGGKVEYHPSVKRRFLRRIFPWMRKELGGATLLRAK